MQIAYITILLFAIASHQSAFGVGNIDRVRAFERVNNGFHNGANVFENNFFFAYSHMKSILKQAKTFHYNSFETHEKDLLDLLYSSIDEEYKTEKPIIFRGNLEVPKGNPVIAATGSNIGDPIYIDSDRVRDDRYSVVQAIGVLAHELGHHHDIKDHDLLYIFGNKLGNLYSGKVDFSLNRHRNANGMFVRSFDMSRSKIDATDKSRSKDEATKYRFFPKISFSPTNEDYANRPYLKEHDYSDWLKENILFLLLNSGVCVEAINNEQIGAQLWNGVWQKITESGKRSEDGAYGKYKFVSTIAVYCTDNNRPLEISLVFSATIETLRNVYFGVEEAGISFCRPGNSSCLTTARRSLNPFIKPQKNKILGGTY